MIRKKSSLFDGLCFFLGMLLWIWVLIAPKVSVLWIVPSAAGMISFQKITLSHVVFFIICLFGMWSLELIHQEQWIEYMGVCAGMCIPMNAYLKARCSFDRVFWVGVSFVFSQYLTGLHTENIYWFLKSLIFPISLCICACNISTIYKCSEYFFEIYSRLLQKHFLIFFVLFNHGVVIAANLVENGFYEGINNKHRVLFLSFVTLPIAWKMIDCKFRKEASVVYILLFSTMWYFQCRLGIAGVLLASIFRSMVLHHRKMAFIGMQGVWISGALGVGFCFKRILEVPWLVSMCSLNSSFYERLIFWRHFEALTQPVFLFGMGIYNFFSSVFKVFEYCGVDGKTMEALPSHTHCIWLDIKLSFGLVGLIALSIVFFWWMVCVWKKIYSLKDAANFGIYIYTFILYVSFFGIFWHTFVLSWALMALIFSQTLYKHVPCGTCWPYKN